MPVLPSRPDLDQLRHQARDLLRAAQGGEAAALARIHAVSEQVQLSSAQLATARGYGFASWTRLVTEVQRRRVLDDRDVRRLAAMLAEDPSLATSEMRNWRDHPRGATPLSYVAMLRLDNSSGQWRDVSDTAEVARALLAAGAPVNGAPDDTETPLMTAASYGDAAVAQVLIDAGADLEAVAAPDAGGVPGGTALLHAAVFGMTEVVDVLVAGGALVDGPILAAAAGDVSGYDLAQVSPDDRLLALIMAADHQRLDVIDALVAAGTPVDAEDPTWHRQALRLAAENGRPDSVRRLLALGADPRRRDGRGRTALDLCRAARASRLDVSGLDEVEAILTAAAGSPPG
jgi:ankyrin repeat protein